MGFVQLMSALGSLIVVILVVVLAFVTSRWYAKKISGGGFVGSGRHIKVVDRVALGQTAGLAIVEVGGKYYFVGISERKVELLCELDDYARFVGEMDDPAPSEPFSSVLRKFMDKAGHLGQKRDEGGQGE